MRVAIGLLIIWFFSFAFIPEGEKNFKKIRSIKKQATAMTTDRLGNLYLINENFIWLYNNQGDSIGAFNSKRYGEISFVDATDPYQILVFFQDYNLIVFLDNYLSVNGDPIDLQTLGFDQVTMACHSRESGFWVYDQLKQKAFHLNDDFEVTHETVNLSQWFGKTIMPNAMIEYNNKLYVNEKESGIYVFDHFATYLKRIPLNSLDQFQVMENRINYFDSSQFCEYDLRTFTTNCKAISAAGAKSARIEKNRLFLLMKKEALIYQTNP